MKNLWVKDRKIVFRELYSTYIEEGYSTKDAKRLAKQEADEIMAEDQMFINDILDEEELISFIPDDLNLSGSYEVRKGMGDNTPPTPDAFR